MIHWLTIIFIEWLMLIYYFHLFSRSNESKITYSENSCWMPLLSCFHHCSSYVYYCEDHVHVLFVSFVCFSIRYMNLIVTCYLPCKNIWQEWKRLSFGFSSFSSSTVILRCLFFFFFFFLIKEPRKRLWIVNKRS